MDTLNLSIRHADDAAVIRVGGHVDMTTASQLDEFTRKARAQQSPHLVFDLIDVPFMDSTGLRVLTDAAFAARRDGGSVVLARLRTQVAHLLRVSRSGRDLAVFPTVEQALDDRPRRRAGPASRWRRQTAAQAGIRTDAEPVRA